MGDGLVIGGVVALGFGTAMMLSASSADQDKNTAGSYSAYKNDITTAHDHGMYGVVGLVAGGALVAGGIAWYATHGSSEHAAVTGWLAPSSGGVAITGGF